MPVVAEAVPRVRAPPERLRLELVRVKALPDPMLQAEAALALRFSAWLAALLMLDAPAVVKVKDCPVRVLPDTEPPDNVPPEIVAPLMVLLTFILPVCCDAGVNCT